MRVFYTLRRVKNTQDLTLLDARNIYMYVYKFYRYILLERIKIKNTSNLNALYLKALHYL